MSLTPGQRDIVNAIYEMHLEGMKPNEITNELIGKRIFKGKYTVKSQKTGIYNFYGIPDDLGDNAKMAALLEKLDKTPPNTIPVEEIKPEPFRVRTWMLVVFILIAGALSYLYSRPKLTVLVPTSTLGPTQTKQPIYTPTEGQGTPLPVVPIFTDTALPTFTPIPPTFTTVPDTFSPTVSPTPLTGVVFQTNFENGYPDSWKGLSNLPPIVDGVLETHDHFTFELGDESWKNYKVEMVFTKISPCGTELRLYLRAQSRADAVEAVICDSYTHLVTDTNGEWSSVAEYGPPGNSFSIEASEDRFTVFGKTAIIENYPSGKIIFFIPDRWGIREIKVTLLP